MQYGKTNYVHLVDIVLNILPHCILISICGGWSAHAASTFAYNMDIQAIL